MNRVNQKNLCRLKGKLDPEMFKKAMRDLNKLNEVFDRTILYLKVVGVVGQIANKDLTKAIHEIGKMSPEEREVLHTVSRAVSALVEEVNINPNIFMSDRVTMDRDRNLVIKEDNDGR